MQYKRKIVYILRNDCVRIATVLIEDIGNTLYILRTYCSNSDAI